MINKHNIKIYNFYVLEILNFAFDCIWDILDFVNEKYT